jgi:2-oxoglutarate dehydrogenase E2 component (dihydrolipoamide succinyltransferase)
MQLLWEAIVCLIDTSAEKPEGELTSEEEEKEVVENKSSKPVETEPTAKTYATGTPSPAAKKILDEKGIAASDIKGTGKDGRITKDDAVKAVPSMGTPTEGNRGTSRTKLSMLRRKVAERLVEAKNTTAMLTTFNEVDMSPIFALRKEYKENLQGKTWCEFRLYEFLFFSGCSCLKIISSCEFND